MLEFNRLIIYGFGKVQLIRTGLPGGTVPSQDLTQLSAFVDHILLQKPEGLALTNYYSITVVNQICVEYVDNNSRINFLVKMEAIDQTLLNSLVTEVFTLINI